MGNNTFEINSRATTGGQHHQQGGSAMYKYLAAALAIVFFSAGSATAFLSFLSGGYQYISADDLNQRLQAGNPMVIVDICPPEEFAEGHIAGSIETNAYPTETAEERARLDRAMPAISASAAEVIIVCPGGGGGAKRSVDYYKSRGVDEKRLVILEKGLRKWPFEKVSR
jgi:rhodanese-related sulfurtransferase